MLVPAAAGLAVAFVVKEMFPLDRLWWIFNRVASMFVVPTVPSVYWDRLSAKGVVVGILTSLVPMTVFVYGNYLKDDTMVVCAALGILVVSLLSCAAFPRNNRTQRVLDRSKQQAMAKDGRH